MKSLSVNISLKLYFPLVLLIILYIKVVQTFECGQNQISKLKAGKWWFPSGS